MSSAEGGGPSPHRLGEDDHGVSDAESASSYIGTGAPDTPRDESGALASNTMHIAELRDGASGQDTRPQQADEHPTLLGETPAAPPQPETGSERVATPPVSGVTLREALGYNSAGEFANAIAQASSSRRRPRPRASRFPARDNAYASPQGRIRSGAPPTYFAPPSLPPGHSHISPPPSGFGDMFAFAGLRRQPPPFGDGPVAPSSFVMNGRLMATTNRPLPPPPQIAEEDECPICHRELPRRILSNSEQLREDHINNCITIHSASSSGPFAHGGTGGHSQFSQSYAIRRTGLFPYLATEKDCVDSEECTICLEEFEVGVPMARLECMCRFHRSCIDRWFVNHPGRCPVHQHDSPGF
ncbi:Uu.00g037400.m01.CDS01 [Anthostomella pinea]|uniref:RING-type E3 ubiquitin transferase n=1 Tax=Anthostomella pinea TaxID=933095 RepID=A0AAI8VA46_9PEZI|nr:Uu.00g037400.m01.CDS01 [Anthostomella pinea]